MLGAIEVFKAEPLSSSHLIVFLAMPIIVVNSWASAHEDISHFTEVVFGFPGHRVGSIDVRNDRVKRIPCSSGVRQDLSVFSNPDV